MTFATSSPSSQHFTPNFLEFDGQITPENTRLSEQSQLPFNNSPAMRENIDVRLVAKISRQIRQFTQQVRETNNPSPNLLKKLLATASKPEVIVATGAIITIGLCAYILASDLPGRSKQDLLILTLGTPTLSLLGYTAIALQKDNNTLAKINANLIQENRMLRKTINQTELRSTDLGSSFASTDYENTPLEIVIDNNGSL